MRVYLVTYSLWDEFHVECVCSSRELAEKALAKLVDNEDLDSPLSGQEDYAIHEWEVDKTNLWTVEFFCGTWRARRVGSSLAQMNPAKINDEYCIIRVEAEDMLDAIQRGREIIELKFPEVFNGKTA